MKHSNKISPLPAIKKGSVACLLLVLMASATAVFAGPQLHSLDIRVKLQQDGSARITETRSMSIDSEGTEVYIVMGHMNGSTVSDLQVTDETGRQYENVGAWDVDRSRSWKAGRCGIVSKSDGYELCWGLGDSGQRTYTTSYSVSDLLRGYQDYDGFNWMFVTEGMQPYPQYARVTIEGEHPVRITPDNTRIWAFRYRGDIRFEGDSLSGYRIVAETSEPFGSGSAMVIMNQFEKGVFQPARVNDSSFEEVKQRAFDGSDYQDEMSGEDWLMVVLMVLGFIVMPILGGLGYLWYVWRFRRKVNKDLLWYRDLPMQGNLMRANQALNAYRYFGSDYNNLLSACILKLIDMGAIHIVTHQTKKGKTQQDFEILELPNAQQQPRLLRQVFDIFSRAAGDDSILEPRELKQYMRASYSQSITDSFLNTLHQSGSISQFKNQMDDVRQLFGLKKFLKEFTLLDERGLNEVGLWKDYIIYATLFGIADQVIKDMKKLNPEFFRMDQVAQQMADDTTLPLIYSTMHRGTARAAMSKAEREARASGRGGSSSWGGGGGFSGGGFGGGVR